MRRKGDVAFILLCLKLVSFVCHELILIRELTRRTVGFRDVNFAMTLVNVTHWVG